MAELEDAAIDVLKQWGNRPLGCGVIGEGMFPGAVHRGSAPFARIAGKVMRRLLAAGRVEWGLKNGTTGYYLLQETNDVE